ncbi:DUF4880 domain-containing protein [Affinibrenneria salicis]|uniref:DUF4880 domain-containing protein n=1 Tax=Affinibrenneria salicis TaxID=2590031 RepID=A0A5J5G349_9GAMM|nr:DUF4880 domain-containing protein [Affinibrenneria salicis]KAA9001288.1 DUF4880 domain-containing protein [Affinibrenneria salicis]
MTAALRPVLAKEVLHAAAEWYAVLYDENCSDDDRRRWRRWLNQHEDHQRAWRQVEQIHARLHAVDGRLASSVLNRRGRERRRMLKLLALVAVSGGVGVSLPWESYAADYRTATGETRELRIADGLTVWMNTDSALNLNTQVQRRVFHLIKGELMLESRGAPPVELITGHGRIDASTPCRLALRYGAAESVLAVFDGLVSLRSADQTRTIGAGQQVAFDQTGCRAPGAVEPFRQSWRAGVLVADNMRLDQLLAEFARYHTGYFRVESQVAGLRISGVFPLYETERFLAALARTLPVRVNRRFAWWVDIGPR